MIKVLRDKEHYASLTKQGVMDVLKEYINSQLDLSRRNMLNNEAFNRASWAHYQASEIGQQKALTKLFRISTGLNMSEQTIFNGEADQTPPVVTPPVTPVVPTELQELVGQGKKYATLDDAIKSVPHAQTHIAKLEQEAAQLREELQKRKAAEDLLADIKAGITQQGETTPKVDLSQETVSNIVKNVLRQEQESNIQAQNAKSVMTAFETAFGDKQKAEQEYIKIAEKNNLPVQMLNQLAMTSPEAVLNLAGLKKTTHPVGKVSSDVNTINFNTTEPEMPSAKLKPGATTKDMVAALQAARQKVLSRQSN